MNSENLPTDTEMMDWLSKQSYITFEAHRQPEISKRTELEKLTEGYNGNVDFFSIPSQHLKDKTLREAVSIAMKCQKEK
jgi:hypothetical protein